MVAAIAGIVDALQDGDEQPLRGWLTEIGIDVEAVRGLPRWNADDGDIAVASQRRGPRDVRQRVEDVLTAAVDRAGQHRYGVALLLLYVLFECEEAWEISYHYDPIWQTLRGAGRSWLSARERVDPAGHAAADAAAVLLELLDQEIQVENAMTSGRLGGVGSASRTALGNARRALALAPASSPDCPQLGSYISSRAEVTRIYYEALDVTGQALHDFLAQPGVSLEAAINALADAERDETVPAARDTSELRAHRFALQSLREQASADWLHVEAGKIIYLYPFAIRGAEPAEVASRAAARAPQWILSGVTPVAVHDSFDLDDVWDGSDFRGRRFDGTLVNLPAITLRDLTGKHLATLEAELRLSKIGNHYLRVEGALADANPHDVYAAMFRAAPEHGTVVVASQGTERTWPRLSAYAMDLAEGVGACLDLPVSARPGMFHVMVVVAAASISTGPAGPRREVQTRAQLVGAVGSQVLVNPVTNCVASLAEWIRYPAPERTGTLELATMQEDMIVRTPNTTLLVALGSPDFHTATRQTVVEFVASLEGLFAGWNDDLATYFDNIDRYLKTPLLRDDTAPAAALGELAATLQNEQVSLHDFAADVRSTVALIESPALVGSPASYTILASLLRAGRFGQQAADIGRKVEEVLDDRLGNRIERLANQRAANEAKVEERRQRIQRARVDTALAIIAAIGVSGLAQIIQAGYDLRDSYALWVSVTILALAIVVGILVWRGTARPGADATLVAGHGARLSGVRGSGATADRGPDDGSPGAGAGVGTVPVQRRPAGRSDP